MSFMNRAHSRSIALLLVITLIAIPAVRGQQAQHTGSLRGQVTDQAGAVIVGASVVVTDAAGSSKQAVTNGSGAYAVPGLAPGTYNVQAGAKGFAASDAAGVEVASARETGLDFKLDVRLEDEQVSVAVESAVSTSPENNKSALVLRGEALDILSDDPDELALGLETLAGPSAGPGGAQFIVDGFTGGKVPPKQSIREVRINQNPFSAEYDKLGLGRVEIFTKPGTEEFHGQGFLNFGDEALNARNPFAPVRAPYQFRLYGGSLSGPVVKNKASFFLNVERREIDENAVVSATVLDSALNPTRFSQTLLTPQRRLSINPRLDYKINANHTLVARYTYTRSASGNLGVGDFSLPSRAYDAANEQHNVQLTETAVLSAKLLNETRFQFNSTRRRLTDDSAAPTLRVLDSFTGGGSQVGPSTYGDDRWELQNHTMWASGQHIVRFGGQVRGVRLNDSTLANSLGTYIFAGRVAPVLDGSYNVMLDTATGAPLTQSITSIEQYRRTLLLQGLGFTPAQIAERGGGASQFSVATGNPESSVSQMDFSAYAQDDWRVRQNLVLSAGLRYEYQTNIHSNFNFAPRLAFAWSPGGGGGKTPAKTVVRGGLGIFYDRFNESYTLQARRFDGLNQQQFIISDPTLLGAFPSAPALAAGEAAQIVRTVDPNLQAPYTIQSGLSVERELPYETTLSASYVNTRGLHLLRARNVNAPLADGLRPSGSVGNVFEYESSGRFEQNQLIVNLINQLNKKAMLFAIYTLNKAESDTDGADTFPSNSYDLSRDYGRSILDTRHRLILGGSISAPWGIRLSPLAIISSPRPFNITTGVDTNGDTLFTERPAFATDLTRPSVVITPFGAFDTNPMPGQTIVPRNYGNGQTFFLTTLRAGKTFAFGAGSKASEKRYKLTASVMVMNPFNRNNLGAYIGNLSSPLFGQANATARGSFSDAGGAASFNSRRVEGQLRLSF
jgi:hypothetical protein